MLAPYVDVLFGHEGDVSAALCDASHSAPWHSHESYGEMASRVRDEFANLKVIATTTRRPKTANRNDWAAFGYAEGKVFKSISFDDLEILDRVGGGDSFAAGLIYGLMEGKGMQWALDCGVAHGALAMTTPGDSSMATLGEVERLMAGGSAGVQR
jgi:2-dehydro-3-deoxygluconokinase